LTPSATSSTPGDRPAGRSPKRSAAVALATLFGLGRLPGAPGTFGAALGVPVAIGLRLAGLHAAVEGGVILALIVAAIPLTGQAARTLGRRDPPEIVLDEFVSIPATFFLVPLAWQWWVLGFALNRALDILKPPPIRRLQRLPGGWGIVADDLAAAVAANVVLQLIARVAA
jgi:phosphatidylglycerophosphatase A